MFQRKNNSNKRLIPRVSLTLFFCLLTANTFAGKPPSPPNATPQVVSVTPSSGIIPINTPTNFTSVYSDADGWQNLAKAQLLINTSTNGAKCFYAYYDQNANKFYLRNDTNKSWLGGYAPGSANIIQNSYATLDCSRSTISGSGTTLSVSWSIAFKSTFTGSKYLYLYVTDDTGAIQGWVNKGTCTITSTPQDTTPPAGTIKVNDDAQYANSSSVTLLLSAPGWELAVSKIAVPGMVRSESGRVC